MAELSKRSRRTGRLGGPRSGTPLFCLCVVALLVGAALAGEPRDDAEALRKACDAKPTDGKSADGKSDATKQAKACTTLGMRQFAASTISAADERRAVEWL